MKISFTIPFYSTPEYLDAAVRSVLAQTENDWELWVVDDRSPHPGIKEQVEGYRDSRIQYSLNDKNLGQSGNWNRCLELARAPLVTILHADDMLHPNYAALMISAHSKYSDASAIFCRAQIVNGVGKKIFSFVDLYKELLLPSRGSAYELSGERGLRSLISGNFIMCPTLCYNREHLGALRFSPDWRCSPDFDFTSRLICAGGKLIGLPDVAFSYRRHVESGTAQFRKNLSQFEEEIRLYDEIAHRAQEKGWNNAQRAAKSKTVVKLRVLYFGLQELFCGQFGSGIGKLKMAARMI